MKTVSVVMTTYNGEKYLREQLDSIIQQTYPIYEIFIQDDYSTDGTVSIVKNTPKYPNIKLFVNEHYIGFNKNFKNACMKASGDFVAISDQDDVWFPEKIEEQIQTIGNYSICCSYLRVGNNLKTSRVFTKKNGFERILFGSHSGHTLLCKTSFIKEEKYWLPSILYNWSLGIKAHLCNGVAIVKQPLNWHRTYRQRQWADGYCKRIFSYDFRLSTLV